MLVTKPTDAALGAVVEGVDLTEGIDTETFEEINLALLKHEVLFFHNQPMKPEVHAQLANMFGEPQYHEAYPHVDGFSQITVLENDKDNPSKIEQWHTDMTFRPCPPLGSILHGAIMPETGGDTMFASMSAAFDGLSEPMKEKKLFVRFCEICAKPLTALRSPWNSVRADLSGPSIILPFSATPCASKPRT